MPSNETTDKKKPNAEQAYERYAKGETPAVIARDLQLDDLEVLAIIQAKEQPKETVKERG